MNQYFYFCSGVYQQEMPEHLDKVRAAAEDAIKSHRTGLNDIYPVYMSGDFSQAVPEFAQAVAQMAWNALDLQGYQMDSINTHASEIWMQEHYKHSAMEQHVHPNAQMVAFYFLESPEGSSRPIFHDPRPGKVMSDLPQKDESMATMASQMINFEPTPGTLILANAWLPHSFTRHGSDQPFRFVHINIYTSWANNHECAVII